MVGSGYLVYIIPWPHGFPQNQPCARACGFSWPQAAALLAWGLQHNMR